MRGSSVQIHRDVAKTRIGRKIQRVDARTSIKLIAAQSIREKSQCVVTSIGDARIDACGVFETGRDGERDTVGDGCAGAVGRNDIDCEAPGGRGRAGDRVGSVEAQARRKAAHAQGQNIVRVHVVEGFPKDLKAGRDADLRRDVGKRIRHRRRVVFTGHRHRDGRGVRVRPVAHLIGDARVQRVARVQRLEVAIGVEGERAAGRDREQAALVARHLGQRRHAQRIAIGVKILARAIVRKNIAQSRRSVVLIRRKRVVLRHRRRVRGRRDGHDNGVRNRRAVEVRRFDVDIERSRFGQRPGNRVRPVETQARRQADHAQRQNVVRVYVGECFPGDAEIDRIADRS